MLISQGRKIALVTEDIVAAIDCGTNSTRLLIETASGEALVREMRITRLGQGVDATGMLAQDALDRTLSVLKDYRSLCDNQKVSRGRLAATSAARDATNGVDFLSLASSITGFRAEIISGVEEGELSFAGAMADLEPSGGDDLVLDIGGGSTELVLVRDGHLRAFSMQAGCVRMTERALYGDPPTTEQILAAQSLIEEQIDLAVEAIPELEDIRPKSRLVGLAGTVATLSMIDQGRAVYDRNEVHHHWLSLERIDEWKHRFACMTIAERASIPGMVEGRQDVIFGGVLVLSAVLHRLKLSGCLSSEADILDGLVASLARSSQEATVADGVGDPS